ncbi:MAG: hypothetical protein AAF907_18435, partial [Planctomycetota bacterium]
MTNRVWLGLVFCAVTGMPAVAAHHAEHVHGPGGGLVVGLGEGGYSVELIVRGGKSLTAVLTDGEGNAVATDGGYLTLTFTESDGEKEDYKIDAGRAEGTFKKTSGHVIGHIVRDAMSVTASVGGAEYSSETFNFPHGPNGGEVVALGGSKLVAELVVDGDVVRVHVLN